MKKHNLQFMVVSTEVVSPRLWFYRNQLAQEVFSLQDLKICKYVPGGHSLMLLWFADLMNVTEEVTNHHLFSGVSFDEKAINYINFFICILLCRICVKFVSKTSLMTDVEGCHAGLKKKMSRRVQRKL